MIDTRSVFYYGFEIDEDNYQLDFNEGGSELTAELAIGSYTATEFLTVLKTALDAAGALTYTVTMNRTTRVITIAATGNFSLLTTSGMHLGTSCFTLIGFSGADKTGAATYSGSAAAGSSYAPQFLLQDYVASQDLQQAVDASVNKTASGRVEVVKFGTEAFMECNIKFATNITQLSGGPITNSATGEDDLRTFMQYLVTKGPIEFMADVSDRATYETMILESTPESQNGTGYRLKEMYDIGCVGYFQTGKLKFRVVEEEF
jgi:hypothetical protein